MSHSTTSYYLYAWAIHVQVCQKLGGVVRFRPEIREQRKQIKIKGTRLSLWWQSWTSLAWAITSILIYFYMQQSIYCSDNCADVDLEQFRCWCQNGTVYDLINRVALINGHTNSYQKAGTKDKGQRTKSWDKRGNWHMWMTLYKAIPSHYQIVETIKLKA